MDYTRLIQRGRSYCNLQSSSRIDIALISASCKRVVSNGEAMICTAAVRTQLVMKLFDGTSNFLAVPPILRKEPPETTEHLSEPATFQKLV